MLELLGLTVGGLHKEDASRGRVASQLSRLRCTALGALSVLALLVPSSLSAETFRFPSQNATYEDVATAPIPTQAGLAKLLLTSPNQVLTLLDHSLELAPDGAGAHRAELEVEFEGRGELIVDVDVGGMKSRLEDDVVVPRQQRRLQGIVRIEPVTDGYRIRIVELPNSLNVAFESRLAGQLVETCQALPLFGLMGIECSTLSGFLSRAEVPLPRPGNEFTLKAAELEPDQRRQLDSYLARHR